jgi:hypothetical protein
VTNTIQTAALDTIPNKTATIRNCNPPWIHNDIRKLIRKRKRAHKSAKRKNTPSHWATFRQLRNKVTTAIRNAKATQIKTVIHQIEDSGTSNRDWWKIAKSLMGQQIKSDLPPLIHDNRDITDDYEKATIFNNYFSDQSTVDENGSSLPTLDHLTVNNLDQINITEDDVIDVLKALNTTKATGPDEIHPRVLREASHVLGKPLAKLFNLSIQTGTFPTMWKRANVTPIHKKDSTSEVSNYRPISLISCLGKVMERCIFKHTYNYFNSNNLLTPLQSGFTPGDSTVCQLIDLYNTFCSALDDGKEIRVIFCDISKAFDRVWHKGLIHKLKKYGVSGKVLLWFKNYLSERKQRVVVHGQNSEWESLRAGVPQGSILGPLLFLIYINDIVCNIHSPIRLFADDTSLYIIVDNPITSAEILNTDLNTIHDWAKTMASNVQSK